MESIAGHSLSVVLTSYDEIISSKAESFSPDNIASLRKKLVKIEAYSDIIDQAVEYEALKPIAANLLSLTENIEKSYKANDGKLTDKSKEDYRILETEIQNLIPLIHKTYYVPGTEAKASLKITEQGIKQIKERLSNYVAGKLK
ncbi:hypothetical protein P4H65_14775 [Paenibacillus chitinolyticus]|uniref:hypothetical protein n=1 Tax=Paenibacillus chitinolyticus TaxID=79263 RepID=UPI002DB5E7D6|nr:hypothetical protein [Paenibacillus chitinolyticus]MEC0247056.1 hypothetical protein [Paenibacillus chitinolyticus]